MSEPKSTGPGKYDDIATMAREAARADGVILIVFNGIRGQGFEVQAPAFVVELMPGLLRRLADDIEQGGD